MMTGLVIGDSVSADNMEMSTVIDDTVVQSAPRGDLTSDK